ncbi:MAG TPA: PD-(D/E)XK nuclease family protein, partial [Acidimicrobiia bacterium]|nr:PD-(D/E)XK nuclease family protein [Acidimicrobiia bacterium]
MTGRLLAQIVSLTPSNYEAFARCPRLFFNESLLGIPASDAGISSDQGMLVHALIYKIHKSGSCADNAHVTDVL